MWKKGRSENVTLTLPPCFSSLKAGDKSPMWKVPSLCQEERRLSYHTKAKNLGPRNLYKTNPVKLTLTSYFFTIYHPNPKSLCLVNYSLLLCLTGVPSLQDLMPDDLRRSGCNNNRNKMHNKRNVLELSPNHPHPHPQSIEKLFPMKLVPGAKKVGQRLSERYKSLLFSSLFWVFIVLWSLPHIYKNSVKCICFSPINLPA